MRPKLTCAVVTAAAAFAVSAPLAHADSVTVSIQPNAAGQASYTGKVKAKRDKCAKGRTVELYDQTSGGFFIGATRTDAKGNYELIEFVPDPGQQVRIAVPAKNRNRGRCEAVQAIAVVPESVVIPGR